MDREEMLAAIRSRHAVRRYTDQPIAGDVRAVLDAAIAEGNAGSGLSITACYDEPEAFSGALAHYGNFRGVRNYLAMIRPAGSKSDLSVGYYGEKIVLLAQHLGLATCWVGLTYNKRQARGLLTPENELRLMIALGHGETPGRAHTSRPLEKLGGVRGGGPMPDWFRHGLEASALAPTALNQQRFHFELDGETVRATPGLASYAWVGLGIAKLHFETGAGEGGWHWA